MKRLLEKSGHPELLVWVLMILTILIGFAPVAYYMMQFWLHGAV